MGTIFRGAKKVGGPKWIRMWSSKMESEAGKIESQPIRRYQLVCCDVGEMQGSKALPCGPCGETVWSEVSSSTTTFGMIWFFSTLFPVVIAFLIVFVFVLTLSFLSVSNLYLHTCFVYFC